MSKMKDSGIEWIGEIPKEWNISKIKYHIFSINSGISLNKDYEFGDYPIYGGGNIMGFCNMYNTTEHAILIGRVGSHDVRMAKRKVWATDNALILRFNENFNDSFGYYLLSVVDLNKLSESNAQPLITGFKLKNVYIPLPSLVEQECIADFLDRKCSEIDSLTSDIEKQIETLEQYKKSVITEAVTKGLDPNAEMKDSGVEWIGEIPAVWDVHPVYYYFGERKNKNSLGQEKNLLSLSYGNIIRKDINSDGGLLPESFNTYNIVEAGDIIIRPTDLQNDKHSLRTGLVKEHGIITSAYIALRPIRPVNTAYYHYLLHAFDVMKVFYNMGNGVRQGLNFPEFSKLLVFEPLREEQDAIVDYLDNKCSVIDSIIADKQSQLDALAEYKKSLIYEYVTGKKEVPSV